MKNSYFILIVFLAFILTLNLNAQTTNSSYSVYANNFHLDAQADSSVGGKSKVLFTVLPRNTKYWFFAYSSGANDDKFKAVNLMPQLINSHIIDKPVLSENDLLSIDIPAGSDSIDIYLLDKNNADLFSQNTDIHDGTIAFKKEGSFLKTAQGVARIEGAILDTLYLGMKNSGALHDISINIEIVYINDVNEKDLKKQMILFSKQFDDQFYTAAFLGDMGWDAFTKGDIEGCIRLSKQALEKDNSLGYVYFNLGLAYLAKGQNTKAKTLYRKALKVTGKFKQPKATIDAAINDIETYMSILASKEVAKQILSRLNSIIEKY